MNKDDGLGLRRIDERLFLGIVAARSRLGKITGEAMSTLYLVGALVSAALLTYLFYALLHPEDFQ